MVKILEIGGRLDAEEDDDDCCEIDHAEFAKKVNLKASDDDDVVVVAARGQIKVKVEVDQSEHSAEILDGHFDSNGSLHECIAGDSLDNPYEIEEDEPTIHQRDTIEAKLDVKCIPAKAGLVKCDFESPLEEVVADMLQVKREPEDGNGVDELLAETTPDMPPPKSEFECFEEVIIPGMLPVKCEPESGAGGTDELFEAEVTTDMSLVKCESDVKCITAKAPLVKCDFESPAEEVVADMLQVKCEPEDGNGADEFLAETIPDMIKSKSGSECLEEVIPDMSPVKCETEDDAIGADELLEEKVIPEMRLLKCGSECFEEVVIPDMSPINHEPEDGNIADDCVGEEDAYDHLPEMDCELYPEGRVFDEEDDDDFVVVGREPL